MTDPDPTGIAQSGMLLRGHGPGLGWATLFRSRETAYAGLLVPHSRVIFFASAIILLSLCSFLALFLDEPLSRFVARTPPALRQIGGYITALGLSGYMFALAAAATVQTLILRWRRRDLALRQELTVMLERCLYVFSCVAVSGIAAQVLKHLVGRARPRMIDTVGPFHFEIFSFSAKLASFPSGHATSIFSVATALGLLLPRLRALLLGTAFVVALSRVVVGSHYVSDTVGGAGLGVLVSMGIAILFGDRKIAFTLTRDRLLVKGSGSVQPALAAALCGTRAPS